MPASKEQAIHFLETQWSSINDNKLKGIYAEIQFKTFLLENNVHFLPGGWILAPGKNTLVTIPGLYKICLIPIEHNFSWARPQGVNQFIGPTPAAISAYNYFRQLGVTTYFLFPDNVDECNFILPSRSERGRPAHYPKPYNLIFKTINPRGEYERREFQDVMTNFPERNGNIGLRCNPVGRINPLEPPWTDVAMVQGLFWFEYARYYCQVDYLVSNNDLDMFLIGQSGNPYPVELKSKQAANDINIGEWFGFDIGPFAKMAFFTSNSMNTDALYVVQEVNEDREHINWLGIRFTDLVKTCSWVFQSGGQGMMGGASSTIKVPKAAFTPLIQLLSTL